MKYWQRRKQERLYKQWAEHAELPPEAIPTPEVPAELPPESIPTSEVPTETKMKMDTKTQVEERNWFYLFRVSIVDLVKKILRVE